MQFFVKCIPFCIFHLLDDVDISEFWEWREGRMLAYELILKFVITNHIHYTFPAYTLTRSSSEMQASMDEALLRR